MYVYAAPDFCLCFCFQDKSKLNSVHRQLKLTCLSIFTIQNSHFWHYINSLTNEITRNTPWNQCGQLEHEACTRQLLVPVTWQYDRTIHQPRHGFCCYAWHPQLPCNIRGHTDIGRASTAGLQRSSLPDRDNPGRGLREKDNPNFFIEKVRKKNASVTNSCPFPPKKKPPYRHNYFVRKKMINYIIQNKI